MEEEVCAFPVNLNDTNDSFYVGDGRRDGGGRKDYYKGGKGGRGGTGNPDGGPKPPEVESTNAIAKAEPARGRKLTNGRSENGWVLQEEMYS